MHATQSFLGIRAGFLLAKLSQHRPKAVLRISGGILPAPDHAPAKTTPARCTKFQTADCGTCRLLQSSVVLGHGLMIGCGSTAPRKI